MKNIWRKIVALICVLTLCVGTINVTTMAGAESAVDSELTLHEATNKHANANNTTSIYVAGYDTLPYHSDWSVALTPEDGDKASGIWVGEDRVGGQLKKYAENAYHVSGFTVEDGQIVTVKGVFGNASTNEYVNIKEIKFIYTNGNWEEIIENPDETGRTFTEIGAYNNATQLSLRGDDSYTFVDWDPAFLVTYGDENGVFYNGAKNTGISVKRTGNCEYFFGIGDGGITAVEGDKIKIRGTFTHNTYSVQYNEVELSFIAGSWILNSDITSYAEGTFWLDTNSPNTATSLYLRGSVDIHEDCTPSDNLDFGWNTTVSTTGFYKDGVACAGTLKNVANGGGWYLGLENAGIEVGNKLTIKGTFGYNGRYVKVAEYSLWYTNDGWKITPAITSDTKLYGDANGDGELNSLDLARLIKHLNEQPVSIYKEDVNGNNTGADANGIDGVNDRDRIKIYEYILEGAKRTVDGSYAVEYYPVYLDDEDIELGAYDGPRMSGKQNYTLSGSTLSSTTVYTDFLNSTEFAKYKNAGFNTLLHELDGAYSSQATGLGYGVTDGNLINYFRLAKETGLDVYITSMGLNSYVRSAISGAGATSGDLNGDGIVSSETVTVDESLRGWDYNGDGTIGTATMSEVFYYSDAIKNAEGKTILEADIEEILDFIVANGYEDIFKGFMMPDEPWYASAERYQNAVELIKAECAERGLPVEFQGCLYPSYANTNAITDNYTSYINAFGTAAGSLMYDFYPLQTESTTFMGSTSSENIMDSAWLTNLHTVATQGKTNKYKTGITLQSCGYGAVNESSWFYSTGNVRRDPSSNADIQFQVYSALAFGMKKINYFTYWEHMDQSEEEAFTSSMVEYPADGGNESVTTDIYTYVQNANAEITKFDHVFMDYDWVETKTVGSSTLFSGLTSTDISGVTVNSSSNASIISHMYDSEKQLDGYWLVNMAEPSSSTKATLNVTFAGKNKAMVYINGEEKIVDLTNGVYEADLAVGEGIFIIPLNIQ